MEQRSINVIKTRNRRFLLFFNFLNGFTYSLFNTLVQPYLYSVLESEASVGLILTIGQFCMFIPQFWIGKISDRFGRKICISLGFLAIIIGMFCLGYFPGIILMELGVILFNIGYAISDSSFNNFVNENRPVGQSASNFGIMFFLYFLGSVVSNGLIDILGENAGYMFYFRLFFFIALGQVLVMTLFLKERELINERQLKLEKIHQEEKVDENHHLLRSKWKIIFHTPEIRNLVIYLTFDGFVWGLALSTYYSGLLANFNINKENIAQMALVFYIFNMLLQIPAGKVVDKIGAGWALITSVSGGFFLFGSIIIAWINRSNSFFGWLIFGQIFFAISVVLYIPTQYSLITSFSEHRNAEIYGTIMAIKGLGSIPTGALGGILMEKVHFLAPIIIVLISLPIEIIFLYFAYVHKRDKKI